MSSQNYKIDFGSVSPKLPSTDLPVESSSSQTEMVATTSTLPEPLHQTRASAGAVTEPILTSTPETAAPKRKVGRPKKSKTTCSVEVTVKASSRKEKRKENPVRVSPRNRIEPKVDSKGKQKEIENSVEPPSIPESRNESEQVEQAETEMDAEWVDESFPNLTLPEPSQAKRGRKPGRKSSTKFTLNVPPRASKASQRKASARRRSQESHTSNQISSPTISVAPKQISATNSPNLSAEMAAEPGLMTPPATQQTRLITSRPTSPPTQSVQVIESELAEMPESSLQIDSAQKGKRIPKRSKQNGATETSTPKTAPAVNVETLVDTVTEDEVDVIAPIASTSAEALPPKRPARKAKIQGEKKLTEMKYSDDSSEHDFELPAVKHSPPKNRNSVSRSSRKFVSTSQAKGESARKKFAQDSDSSDLTELSPSPKKKQKIFKSEAATRSESALAKNSSSPSKFSHLSPFASPTKFGNSLSQQFERNEILSARAPNETDQERAKNWNLNAIRLGWVKLTQSKKTFFWWPARIHSRDKRERPLSVQLINWHESPKLRTISPEFVLLDSPSAANILSFRTRVGAKIRFDKTNFASAPAEEFEEALLAAHAIEDREVDDEGDDVTDRENGTTAHSAADSSDLSEWSSDSDDLLAEVNEIPIGTPLLGKLKPKDLTWWPCRLLSFDASAGCAKPYFVEWVDAEKSNVSRKDLLTVMEKQFFTVPVAGLRETSDAQRREMKNRILREFAPILQKVMDETFPVIQSRNDKFYSMTTAKSKLIQQVDSTGDFSASELEFILETVRNWAFHSEIIPTGSERYNNLTRMQQEAYCTDVLYPVAVILETIEMNDFREEVSDENENLTEDEIWEKCFRLAEAELGKYSILQSVLSARAARDVEFSMVSSPICRPTRKSKLVSTLTKDSKPPRTRRRNKANLQTSEEEMVMAITRGHEESDSD